MRATTQRITQFDTVQQLAYAKSEVGLRLDDGSIERVMLETACPTEFIVHEPTVNDHGDLKLSLEIIRFELVGNSEVLWPGQPVRVLGGALSAPDARPILGSVEIPFGRDLAEGVASEQVLYLTIETPVGTLHNNTPVRMTGQLYRIPPIGSLFESKEDVPLFDERGIRRLELWSCANEA